MKIIHTSDWHLGQHFYHFDRHDEHQYFIEQLCAILRNKNPDALIISGDIFDNIAPAASVQKLFVNAILSLHEANPQSVIVLSSGNHDSGPRLEVTKRLWQEFGVHIFGSCQRNEDGTFNPSQYILKIKDRGFVIAVPYFHASNYPVTQVNIEREVRPKRFFHALLTETAKQNSSNLPVILMAHIAVKGCDIHGHEEYLIGDMEQTNIDTFGSGYDYLALGHIHKPQSLTSTNAIARYSGSPIPLSFSENYEHSVSFIELQNHNDRPHLEIIPITPLRKIKTIPEKGSNLEYALQQLEQLDDTDTSYIRLLIDQEGILPADAEHRAMAIAQTKQCRFCEIRKKTRSIKKLDPTQNTLMEVEELKEIPPLYIANRYYKSTIGHPLTDEFTNLIQQAIDEVNNDNLPHTF